MSKKDLYAVAALVLALATTAHAQNRGSAATVQDVSPKLVLADSDISVIMQREQVRGISASDVSPILRQRGRAHSRARQDSLADSLTARILASTESTGPVHERAQELLSALAVAGKREGDGTVYPGALDRLIRIHKESRDQSIRPRVLWVLIDMDDRERAMAYLRQVATSSDASAHWAVGALAISYERHDPGVEAILRDLWDHKLVKEPNAAQILLMFGSSIGWKPPDLRQQS
jgi:hypothetical protein